MEISWRILEAAIEVIGGGKENARTLYLLSLTNMNLKENKVA